MHRSKLKNAYIINLRKGCFQWLNVKYLFDNKKFWKTIKPYFSDKGLNSNKLLMREEDHLISDEKELTNLMNSLCINTTSELDLKKYTERNFPYYNYNFGCGLREVSISSKYETIKGDF